MCPSKELPLNMKKPIFLVGMMGSWKSTVGKMLAENTGLDFIDIDDEIERKTSLMVEEIFIKYGESRFREFEIEMLRQSTISNNRIIATGGGVVNCAENRTILKKNGYTIYLQASPGILASRIRDIKKRPLLNIDTPLDIQLENIFNKRKNMYQDVAHFILDTNKLSVEQTTETIKYHIVNNNANN